MYRFFKAIKSYEIYLLNNPQNTFVTAPEILSSFYENKEISSIDLFILDNFFAVYKNTKLYCFKTFNKSTHEDIETYVMQTYKINLDNTYAISNKEFKKLNLLYKKQSNFKRLKQNNPFLFFTIFASIMLMIGLFYSYNIFNASKQNNLQEYHNKIDTSKIVYKKIVPKLIDLFKYIKIENLVTSKIVCTNTKIKLILVHGDKKKLLNFATIYSKDITIKSIEFLKDKELFSMEIEVAI